MKALINNEEVEFIITHRNQSRISLLVEGREFSFTREDLSLNISDFGIDLSQIFDEDIEAYAKILPKAKSSSSSSMKEGSLLSPMPGKIFKVLLKEGDSVKAGETILIMEAMKMEHTIKANKDGVVKTLLYKEGDQVSGSSLLCELD